MDKMAQSGMVNPPKFITNSFSANFPSAINPEWHLIDSGFEAVFQENASEAIAQFNKYGALTEVRRAITANELPQPVLHAIGAFGEIMNLIIVTKKNKVLYEFIFRDKMLNRFLVLVGNDGSVLQNEQL